MVEVAGTYRARRGEIAPEQGPRARAEQSSVPDFVTGALLELQAGQADTNRKVSELAEALTRLTATWKDKAVTQFGAIALAALGIIGGQYALREKPAPARTEILQSELQIRADGCAKMANGSDTEYQRCMVRDVVAPNTPSVQAFRSR